MCHRMKSISGRDLCFDCRHRGCHSEMRGTTAAAAEIRIALRDGLKLLSGRQCIVVPLYVRWAAQWAVPCHCMSGGQYSGQYRATVCRVGNAVSLYVRLVVQWAVQCHCISGRQYSATLYQVAVQCHCMSNGQYSATVCEVRSSYI